MSMVHDTATLLANGQVLLAGRTGLLGNPGDLFNPATDTFRTTLGSMEFATNATTATLLENRQVLFTGGNAFRVTASIRALLYDPKTETFNPAVSGLTVPRVEHTATLLPNGKVLIVGGLTGTCNPSCVNGTTLFWNTAELYDPTAKTFSQVTGVMASPRFGHTATLICR
jgi:Galactose oxidase, central domain